MDTKQKIKIMEDLSLNACLLIKCRYMTAGFSGFLIFIRTEQTVLSSLAILLFPYRTSWITVRTFMKNGELRPFTRLALFWTVLLIQRLMERGYFMAHVTEVMTRSLYAYKASGKQNPNITLHTEISDQWLKGLFAMKGMTNETHLKIVPSMYAAIPKDTLAVCAWHSGRIIGTG